MFSYCFNLFDDKEFSRENDQWYYFLHVPKTAGTSFRFVLYDYFKQYEIYPNYPRLIFGQGSQYIGWKQFKAQEQNLFPIHKKVLIGHFGQNPIQFYKSNPPITLSILREPIERVKSSIIYHMIKGRRYHGMSIDEIIDQYAHREGLVQPQMFGYRSKEKNLDQALRNITNLDFVGISERFEQSIQLCNHKFDWTLKTIEKKNVGLYNKDSFTVDQIERIKDACEIDFKVYARALELFEERYTKMQMVNNLK